MTQLVLDPGRDCNLCPRLEAFRLENRVAFPDWHNAPVDTWVASGGDDAVQLLIIGLAPGLRGANRTARPFTGDFAGDLLYATLQKFGMANGHYGAESTDGMELLNCAITNAVRCVPPQNKPVGHEINQCRQFLKNTIARFENLKCMVTLGKISHDSTLRTLGLRVASYPFGHGAKYEINGTALISSYHCSRYNTNTGRLTEAMFEDIFAQVSEVLS